VVDDYFLNGPRDQQLLGARTVWHHRTVEDYVSGLLGAGFTLTGLRECVPRRARSTMTPGFSGVCAFRWCCWSLAPSGIEGEQGKARVGQRL
jgi:hypothetical protein